MPLLVALLRSGELAVQQQAASVLGTLSCSSPGVLDALIAAGAVPQFVAMLRSDEPAMQDVAARALWHLGLGCSRIKLPFLQQTHRLCLSVCQGQTTQLCNSQRQALCGA